MSRGSLARALSMDCRAARSPCMTVMMLSHSICPPARRNLMLVSAGGTQAHVGDTKSTLGCGGRGGGLSFEGLWACSVGCAGPAHASDWCICLCSNANRMLVTLHAHTSAREHRLTASLRSQRRLGKRYNIVTRARRRMCGLDPRVTHTVNHNACACGIVKCTVKRVA